MTSEEQLSLVNEFYALSTAGDHAEARSLLTEDFSITVPPYMPFAGEYRGKDAFRTLIPRVAETVGLEKLKFIATTAGDDHVVKLVEFTLTDGSTVEATEVVRFRAHRICEIRPFFYDPAPMISAAERRRRGN